MKLICVLFLFVSGYSLKGYSQETIKIDYSRVKVFVENPDRLELVSNIAGQHHLLSFNKEETPVIFIFNSQLELMKKTSIPFKFPEKSDIKIISFPAFYYLFVHARNSTKYFVYKIDGNGNNTDLSLAFKKLLLTQSNDVLRGFQLMPDEKGFCMLYHTDIINTEKNTLMLVKTDSLFNAWHINKVVYDLKKQEEVLRQEILMFGKYLLVLKSAINTTALELMKVNIAEGVTIKNTFSSSGYSYRQPSIDFNIADSTITLTAQLTDGNGYSSKNYVFISRLNHLLIEQVPFTILKSQFAKKTGTNFLFVNQSTKWLRFRSGYQQSENYGLGNISLYRDYIMPDSAKLNSTVRTVTTTTEKYTQRNDEMEGIRFSLIDKNFKIINDRYVSNTKISHTILPYQFTSFNTGNKAYMLAGQRFSGKFNGLLMVSTNNNNQLQYSDVRVDVRKEYLLEKCRVISNNSILMPFLYRREAGLIKLTIE